jgi:Rrf2 family protein
MAGQKKGQPIASHLIARKKGIPERFLLKVLKPLVSARVLSSVKGPNGGYHLARAPGDITLLDVIEAVDGPISGQAPAGQQDGQLNRRLEHICNQTAEQVRKQLGKIRVSELTTKD